MIMIYNVLTIYLFSVIDILAPSIPLPFDIESKVETVAPTLGRIIYC